MKTKSMPSDSTNPPSAVSRRERICWINVFILPRWESIQRRLFISCTWRAVQGNCVFEPVALVSVKESVSYTILTSISLTHMQLIFVLTLDTLYLELYFNTIQLYTLCLSTESESSETSPILMPVNVIVLYNQRGAILPYSIRLHWTLI